MNIEADDLLAQIRQDHPLEYELSRLSLLCNLQAAEIERLTAAQAPTYPVGGSFSLSDQDTRHG